MVRTGKSSKKQRKWMSSQLFSSNRLETGASWKWKVKFFKCKVTMTKPKWLLLHSYERNFSENWWDQERVWKDKENGSKLSLPVQIVLKLGQLKTRYEEKKLAKTKKDWDWKLLVL